MHLVDFFLLRDWFLSKAVLGCVVHLSSSCECSSVRLSRCCPAGVWAGLCRLPAAGLSALLHTLWALCSSPFLIDLEVKTFHKELLSSTSGDFVLIIIIIFFKKQNCGLARTPEAFWDGSFIWQIYWLVYPAFFGIFLQLTISGQNESQVSVSEFKSRRRKLHLLPWMCS